MDTHNKRKSLMYCVDNDISTRCRYKSFNTPRITIDKKKLTKLKKTKKINKRAKTQTQSKEKNAQYQVSLHSTVR